MNTATPSSLRDVKLVAFDLDGTLLDAQLNIRPAVHSALNTLRAKGIQVMLITGRHHITTAPYIAQLGLDTPAICCNGSYIYDFKQGHTLFARPLSHPQADALLTSLRAHNLSGFLYADDKIAYEQADDQIQRLLDWGARQTPGLQPKIIQVSSLEDFARTSQNLWKMIVSPKDSAAFSAFSLHVMQTLKLECEQSGKNWFDIAQTGNSKGSTLAYWLREQAISPYQLVVFGDNHNDVGMFKLAGLGIAMGNAVPAVQAQAHRVIGHHNSDAIAEAIERYVMPSIH